MPEPFASSEKKKVESLFRFGTDILPGEVRIDPEKCKGCGLCAGSCSTGVLEVVEEKARMINELPLCIGCADCMAICPEDAIELVQPIGFRKAFRFLDRGDMSMPRRF